MSKTVINGIFLTQRINGVQRYGLEIVKSLDRMVGDSAEELEIAVPGNWDGVVNLDNISVVKIGRRSGKLWEQTDLVRYLRKQRAQVLCFENIVPLLYRKGVVVIHDISFKANPAFFNASAKGRISMAWRRLNYYAACRSGMQIITDSEFSKSELLKYYKVDPDRITVAGCGWQHMGEIESDDSLFDIYPHIKWGRYYFAMATLAKWKNFKWILSAARTNTKDTFVIAGGGSIEDFLRENDAADLANVILPGYITDGQARSLMSGCKAFLFPTLYEGFGLPPLEAAAVGADAIVVSDIDVMHEVYGEAGIYTDPHDPQPKLKGIKAMADSTREALLNKYSWDKSAEKILSIIKSDNTGV